MAGLPRGCRFRNQLQFRHSAGSVFPSSADFFFAGLNRKPGQPRNHRRRPWTTKPRTDTSFRIYREQIRRRSNCRGRAPGGAPTASKRSLSPGKNHEGRMSCPDTGFAEMCCTHLARTGPNRITNMASTIYDPVETALVSAHRTHSSLNRESFDKTKTPGIVPGH